MRLSEPTHPSGCTADGTILKANMENSGEKLKGYLTIEEAAQRCRFDPTWIFKLLKQGRLKGIRVGDIWLVTETSIKRYMKMRKRPGTYPRTKAQ